MLSSFSPAGRARLMLPALIVGAVALGIAGCGRRGQPEPPPDPNAPNRAKPGAAATQNPAGRRPNGGSSSAGNRVEATPTTLATRPGALVENTPDDESDEVDPSTTVSPQPTPTSRRRRPAYQVPKEPFFLDPLL